MLPEEVLKKTRKARFHKEMDPLYREWIENSIRSALWMAGGFIISRTHKNGGIAFLVTFLAVTFLLGYLSIWRLAKIRTRRKEKDLI